MKKSHLCWQLAILMLFLSHTVLAGDWHEGDAAQATLGGDYYAAGRNIELTADVEGDVFAAGCPVLIESHVKGDGALAGCQITLRGKIDHDLYAAGGSVRLEGEIAGNARMAGGQIILSRQSRIAGRTTLAGNRVEISGNTGPYLKVFAGTLRLNGEVQGDVDLTARSIEIGPAARIMGKLIYRSAEEARIDPAAQIAGGTTRLTLEVSKPAAQAGRVALVVFLIFKLVCLLGLMLLGAVLILVFPKFAQDAAGTIASDPGKSLALGLALLVTLPVAAMLLMMTVIGIPLGMTVLLFYPLALVIGYLTAAYFIGVRSAVKLRQGIVMTRGKQIVSLLLALLALSIIGLVPVLGGLVIFIALLAGLGAWMLHGYRLYV
ncbi:MAG TPA: polymer-forming cytoskeletal protein [Gammaproteobacteria bacterium]|nr:polymer-forming cytoskeletal protein [Gammaproteobacteria bacterium]